MYVYIHITEVNQLLMADLMMTGIYNSMIMFMPPQHLMIDMFQMDNCFNTNAILSLSHTHHHLHIHSYTPTAYSHWTTVDTQNLTAWGRSQNLTNAKLATTLLNYVTHYCTLCEFFYSRILSPLSSTNVPGTWGTQIHGRISCNRLYWHPNVI